MIVGIHASRKITLEDLSTHLVGFLEFIPFNHFRQLQSLHYKSLLSFAFEDPAEVIAGNKHPRKKTYYFILFGPLAVVNSDNQVSVRYFNFDDRDGSLLIWRMQYRMVDEDTDNDIETRIVFWGPRSFQFDLEMNYNIYCMHYIIREDYWRPLRAASNYLFFSKKADRHTNKQTG